MRRSRTEIESRIPPLQDQEGPASETSTSLPQIRRQVERICEALRIQYDDLYELHIKAGQVLAVVFLRNEEGEFYLDEFGKAAMNQLRFSVDTETWKGDERDI